jgi:hypothetical protein
MSLSVHIVWMALSLNGLRNDAVRVSGFSDEDVGIVKLNAASKVDDVYS